MVRRVRQDGNIGGRYISERSKGEILNFIFTLKLPLAFLEKVQEIIFQLLFNVGPDETLG